MTPTATRSPDPFLHQRLAQRYLLTRLLGQGSMGRVYLAEDQLLGHVTVAVKILSQSLTEERARQRFEREATACAYLGQKSLHIVRVNDYGITPDGIPFYVMEYLAGKTLRDILETERLTLPRFLRMARQIALGLKAAHDGIQLQGKSVQVVHRDLKPANVLVVPDDSLGELAKIVDFGIAKLVSETGPVTVTHAYVGTMAFSSPEQLEGLLPDPRSDIYSFGVMMYQMVSGRLPLTPTTESFPGWYQAHHKQRPTPLSELVPDVGSSLSDLIMSCLAKKPEQRPQTVAEIASVLQSLASQQPAAFLPTPLPSSTGGILSGRTQTGGRTQSGGKSKTGVVAAGPATRSTRHIPAAVAEIPDVPANPFWKSLGALGAGSLVGLLAVGVVGGRILFSDPYQAAMQSGTQALQSQDYPTAVTQFELALQHRPNDRQALLNLNQAKRAQPIPSTDTATQPQPDPTSTPLAGELATPPDPIAPQPGNDPLTSPELQANAPQPLKTFPVSTAQESVRDELGQPDVNGTGTLPNTVYDLYQLQQGQVDLGLVYDRVSRAVRQTEASLDPEVPPQVAIALLQHMLQVTQLPPQVQLNLDAVLNHAQSRADFQVDNLRGTIARTVSGDVYISTWDPTLGSAPTQGIEKKGSTLRQLVERNRARR